MRVLERLSLLALLLVAAWGLYKGWQFTWFLTDDAFITFRYAINSMRGFGYVWNPPPFHPVEGYTSFLWLLLLDGVWRTWGIAPPDSSTVLSLIFALGTLLLSVVMVWRMGWRPALRPFRLLFLALFLVGLLGNRTFLTWSSSGLETALFNFTFTLWIATAFWGQTHKASWVLLLALAATLAALTRPDGLLLVAATLAILVVVIVGRLRRQLPVLRYGLAALPLLLIPLHLLWRHGFYGEWLPNTYYAKVTQNELVLEAGSRYLLSFILEYGVWSWLVLGVWVAIAAFPQAMAWWRERQTIPISLLIQIAAVGTVVAHFAYYTFVVGGDHFEYRVYSHLIPFLFLALLWMLNRLTLRPTLALCLLLVVVLGTLPLQWYQWQLSQRYTTRAETFMLRVPTSRLTRFEHPWVPEPMLRYLAWYDHQQSWLIGHFIGVRQREHDRLVQETLPGWAQTPLDTPVYRDDTMKVTYHTGVGMLGYQWNDVAILDVYGLNDYVVARNPMLRAGALMAHERQPPIGYIECFLPTGEKTAFIPLSRIIACEQQYIPPDKYRQTAVVPE